MDKIFKKIGLDEFQGKILEYLIKNGCSKPSSISNILDICRPTVYKALYELEDLQLVKRVSNGSGDDDLVFEAKSPYFIKQLLTKKISKLERVEEEFDQKYSEMVEFFLNKSKNPVIDIFYGVEGLKKVHLQIESKKSPVKIIRSSFDRETQQLYEEIDRHVAQRGKLNVKSQIITPLVESVQDTKKEYPVIAGREIKIVSKELLDIPTQVMIFDDKVALTNYDEQIITILIHQKDIYMSFLKLFELLWKTVPSAKL